MRATVAKKVTEREGEKEKIKCVLTLDVADRDNKLIEYMKLVETSDPRNRIAEKIGATNSDILSTVKTTTTHGRHLNPSQMTTYGSILNVIVRCKEGSTMSEPVSESE